MEEQAGPPAIPSLERVPPTESKAPSRIFWVILSVILICGMVCIAVAAALSLTQTSPKPLLQVVRLNFQNRPGSPMNQSAFVNKSKNTVTYCVTSPSNQTSLVLFDRKNGYVCYKPSGQSGCYLRMMDTWDREIVQMSFNLSEQRVGQGPLLNSRTQYYREFLEIVPGRQVQPEEAGEAVWALCEQAPIYWVKRKDGPPKQRLIYLCIDICFPSNICVSICFYYLPE
ncbi:BRICHOS domain-containing protein 5 isoform X2 [Sceloporus undulatus]|uniref:BRICHOS domain-containing protein 5 isoform X2 n=1 Tax=Sceloporus undulatus TaxID=8520 RepID=UPI001C4C970C|nr:BRICHOS domain-containing protein 5 isoform X2 [Sceloporus undulatus]